MGATRKGSCRVCVSPMREQIEDARAAGCSFDALAERFGIPRSTIHGHWSDHVGPERKLQFLVGKTTVQQMRERAVEENLSLLDYLGIVRSVLTGQLMTQAEAGSAFGVSAVAGRMLDVLREIGKITGEIEKATVPAGTIVNIGINAAPGFADLQNGLLALCRSHPDARADIIDLLRRLHGTPEPAPRPALAIEHERADA